MLDLVVNSYELWQSRGITFAGPKLGIEEGARGEKLHPKCGYTASRYGRQLSSPSGYVLPSQTKTSFLTHCKEYFLLCNTLKNDSK